MLKTIFFILLAVACAKHPVSESKAGLAGFAGENFSSTNSACLDGTLVAIDHHCAVPMIIEEGYPYILVRCEKVREGSPPWNEYNVLVLTNAIVDEPHEAVLICEDPHARVYVQKHP
jgi:hypothetical protein